ncbi:MAG TPA: hypothetical protein VER04_08150 [Polyangiaceae bacterium]|nr:hypothetical protein [Polyangiaceae bacterium]
MKKFLVLYRSTISAAERMAKSSPEQPGQFDRAARAIVDARQLRLTPRVPAEQQLGGRADSYPQRLLPRGHVRRRTAPLGLG